MMSEDTVDAKGHKKMDQTDAQLSGASAGSASSHPQQKVSDFISDCYKMNHENRGIAVIINNKCFNPQTKMNKREGTDKDAYSMYELLDKMGFEQIHQYDNQTVKQMRDQLIEVSKADHSKNDCFVCVILTHGEEGYVYGVDNKIAIDELVRPFKGLNCKSLAGKPKLFFIQACRGDELDSAVTVADALGSGDEEGTEVDMRRIPTEADFLMAYSVVPGYFSWRNSDNGSWFIQAVVDVFKKNWQDMDVLTMLTRVNKCVAYNFESRHSKEAMNKKKQMPCVTSMLTKDIFFKK